MTFQEIAKSVRAEAESRGLRATMSRLNDAIALACYGKKYAAVIAAERSGKLPPLPSPPPNIQAAARRYRIDEHAFGLALHAGIDGPVPANDDATVEWVMSWLLAQHKTELERLEQEELQTLAAPDLVDRVLTMEGYSTVAIYGFAEWVIAEGSVKVGGRSYRVAELLLGGPSRPGWNARQRAYLRALADTPLRLYLIEEVVAGYHLILRQIGAPAPKLIKVVERSGSRPEVVGEVIGARVIGHNGHLELAGGLYSFSRLAGMRLAEAVRAEGSATAVSRLIRSAWFEQFDQAPPTFVVGASGEPLRLVTDLYRCTSIETLAQRLAMDPRVQGDADLGWSLAGSDGVDQGRPVCSVYPSDDVADGLCVFYESEQRAERYRRWFESLAGDSVAFVERESLEPYEAAIAHGDAARAQPQVPPEVMTQLLREVFEDKYADFADHPLPIFGGATPRQMLEKPGGEARVRELLATFESGERHMAQQDRREPVAFSFLYRKLGLSETSTPIQTRSAGLHPPQFEVNEAWLVFRLLDEPIVTQDAGMVEVLGLMDAGSTCILNFRTCPVGKDLTEFEARSFFQALKVAPAPPPPRRLFIASDVQSDSVRAEAGRLGMAVTTVDPSSLDGIVGPAREAMGSGLDKAMGGR